jgi:hypothetical protein
MVQVPTQELSTRSRTVISILPACIRQAVKRISHLCAPLGVYGGPRAYIWKALFLRTLTYSSLEPILDLESSGAAWHLDTLDQKAITLLSSKKMLIHTMYAYVHSAEPTLESCNARYAGFLKLLQVLYLSVTGMTHVVPLIVKKITEPVRWYQFLTQKVRKWWS